jgi:hypothetical protein
MNKLYRMMSGAAVAMLLAVVSGQTMAGPVYTFSFESTTGSYLGTVAGRIFGLPDSTPLGDGASASGVTIDVGPSNGISAVFDSFDYNFFSIDSGEILSGEIGAFSSTTGIFLDLCLNETNFCPGSSYGEVLKFINIDEGELLASAEAVAFEQVPAPATWLLLFFGGLGLHLRKAAGVFAN